MSAPRFLEVSCNICIYHLLEPLADCNKNLRWRRREHSLGFLTNNFGPKLQLKWHLIVLLHLKISDKWKSQTNNLKLEAHEINQVPVSRLRPKWDMIYSKDVTVGWLHELILFSNQKNILLFLLHLVLAISTEMEMFWNFFKTKGIRLKSWLMLIWCETNIMWKRWTSIFQSFKLHSISERTKFQTFMEETEQPSELIDNNRISKLFPQIWSYATFFAFFVHCIYFFLNYLKNCWCSILERGFSFRFFSQKPLRLGKAQKVDFGQFLRGKNDDLLCTLKHWRAARENS